MFVNSSTVNFENELKSLNHYLDIQKIKTNIQDESKERARRVMSSSPKIELKRLVGVEWYILEE